MVYIVRLQSFESFARLQIQCSTNFPLNESKLYICVPIHNGELQCSIHQEILSLASWVTIFQLLWFESFRNSSPAVKGHKICASGVANNLPIGNQTLFKRSVASQSCFLKCNTRSCLIYMLFSNLNSIHQELISGWLD